MAFYGSARSRRYHATRTCNHCYVENPVLISDLSGKEPCPSCVSLCVACHAPVLGKPAASFECGHAFCEACVDQIVQGWRNKPACPCGAALIAAGEGAVSSLLSRGTRPATACDSLNRTCPHCGEPFSDFDGCAAVMCSCRGFFCGLCMQPCADSEAAHAHVSACPLNTCPGQYFVPADHVEAIVDAQKRQAAEREVAQCRSSLHSACVAYELEPHVDLDMPVYTMVRAGAQVGRLLVKGALQRVAHFANFMSNAGP